MVPRPHSRYDASQCLRRSGRFLPHPKHQHGRQSDHRQLDRRRHPSRAGASVGANPFGTFYEIPIAIQDRSFNTNGSLFYPDTRAFFDGFLGPYIPGSNVSPIWNPEFFGNCIVVNGRTWPFLEVEPRRYRFRLLNGCQSRFLILKFSDPKVDVWQIGAEGGFLRAPVNVSEILMAPAERADVIVDFSRVKFGTNVTLLNLGPDAPFAGGGFRRADPQSTGLVMQFRVNQPLAGVGWHDAARTARHAGATATDRRTRAAASAARTGGGGAVPHIPIEARLGTFDPAVGTPAGITFLNGKMRRRRTQLPDATEVWELYNFTPTLIRSTSTRCSSRS